MSKHWNPDDDIGRVSKARAERAWPKGATAGLTLLAVSCLGIAALLYRVAGPRDLIGP